MPDLAEAQRAAVEEVKTFTDSLSQISLVATDEWRGRAALKVDLDTSGFSRGAGGLDVQPIERVVILILRTTRFRHPLPRSSTFDGPGSLTYCRARGFASTLTLAPSGTPPEACRASCCAFGNGSRTQSAGDSTRQQPSITQLAECFIAPRELPRWWPCSPCRATSLMKASCIASRCGREPIIGSISQLGRHLTSPASFPACLSSLPSTCRWEVAIACLISWRTSANNSTGISDEGSRRFCDD